MEGSVGGGIGSEAITSALAILGYIVKGRGYMVEECGFMPEECCIC